MSIVKTYIGFGVRLVILRKTILVDSIAKFKCHYSEKCENILIYNNDFHKFICFKSFFSNIT